MKEAKKIEPRNIKMWLRIFFALLTPCTNSYKGRCPWNSYSGLHLSEIEISWCQKRPVRLFTILLSKDEDVFFLLWKMTLDFFLLCGTRFKDILSSKNSQFVYMKIDCDWIRKRQMAAGAAVVAADMFRRRRWRVWFNAPPNYNIKWYNSFY